MEETFYSSMQGEIRPAATPTIRQRVVNRYEIPATTILKDGEIVIERYGNSSVMKVGDGRTEYQYLPNIGSYDNERNIYDLQQENKNNKQQVDYLSSKAMQSEADINRLQNLLNEVTDRMNRTVKIIHNCRNCGAKLEVPENSGVFHCKYCGTAYVLGAIQVRSTY